MKKKTKIVATISDRNCEPDFLKRLHQEGMDVVRINTAHQTPEDTIRVIRNVRAVSDRIAILIDTKGPEVRTLGFEPLDVTEGMELRITGNKALMGATGVIGVTYSDFVTDVVVGARVLVDDGDIAFLVQNKDADYLYCVVENEGTLKAKKSVNVPGASFRLPALNDKDRDYIQLSIDEDVDFIAHSFVRTKHDVAQIQEILDAAKSKVKIVAKIENQEGIDNIDEILECVYGIMVARGDLGIEIPGAKLPAIQKMLVRKAMQVRKPVIIATHMLHSMIENPRPTRAEINDIANAIYDGTDAVMLSGETAYGKYPLEAVQTMANIAVEVESSTKEFRRIPTAVLSSEISGYLTKLAVEASVELNTKAIVADSTTGRTIRNLAGYRGTRLVFALCYEKRTMRELALSYGVWAQYMERRQSTDDFTRAALGALVQSERLKSQDTITVIAGNFGRSTGASYLEIATVQNLLDRY